MSDRSKTEGNQFSPIPEILEELRAGRMIVLVDDEDRENEGDLCMAAEKVSPDAINFMVRHGRGLVCVPLEAERIDRLGLHPQTPHNNSHLGTAFTVSVDAARGISTGISAADRAATVRQLIRSDCRPEDLARPGHVFPLRAEPGGTLVRTGHTEGILDLCNLAGLDPSGVICEILNDDGSMARLPDLRTFAQRHSLKMTTIAELIEYRRQHEQLVEREVSLELPTRFGNFDVHVYRSKVDKDPHLALCRGVPHPDRRTGVVEDPVMVRVHSSCLTGDVLESLRCDCGSQLHQALEKIGAAERGVLLYMQQEGRGIGLVNKLKAYVLQQQQGLDTVEANQALGFPPDVRHYGIGAQILRDLGVRKLRLLTNNPRKYHAIRGYNLQIVERIPLWTAPNPRERALPAYEARQTGPRSGSDVRGLSRRPLSRLCRDSLQRGSAVGLPLGKGRTHRPFPKTPIGSGSAAEVARDQGTGESGVARSLDESTSVLEHGEDLILDLQPDQERGPLHRAQSLPTLGEHGEIGSLQAGRRDLDGVLAAQTDAGRSSRFERGVSLMRASGTSIVRGGERSTTRHSGEWLELDPPQGCWALREAAHRFCHLERGNGGRKRREYARRLAGLFGCGGVVLGKETAQTRPGVRAEQRHGAAAGDRATVDPRHPLAVAPIGEQVAALEVVGSVDPQRTPRRAAPRRFQR